MFDLFFLGENIGGAIGTANRSAIDRGFCSFAAELVGPGENTLGLTVVGIDGENLRGGVSSSLRVLVMKRHVGGAETIVNGAVLGGQVKLFRGGTLGKELEELLVGGSGIGVLVV